MRRRPNTIAGLMLVGALAVVAGCSDGDDGDTGAAGGDETAATSASVDETAPFLVTLPTMLEVEGAPFVAATTWSAAFVRAAGADTVTVLVPAGTPDPFGYEAPAEDLAAVGEADFVVVDGREAVVDEITDALPTEGEIITFTLSNDPAQVKALVLGLAERFMLGTVAQDWSAAFDAAVTEWEAELDAARPSPPPTAVVDEALVPWATLAGLEVVGTFDAGAPVTTATSDELATLDADLVLVAEETPPPPELDLGSGTVVELTNFPDESLDLMVLFQTNVDRLLAAL